MSETATQAAPYGWAVDAATGRRMRPATRQESVESALSGPYTTIPVDGHSAYLDGEPAPYGTGYSAVPYGPAGPALIIGEGYASCSACGRRADASQAAHDWTDRGEPCGRSFSSVAPAYERGAAWELRGRRDAAARFARQHALPTSAPQSHRYAELDDPVRLGDGTVSLDAYGPGTEAAQARRSVRPRWWQRRRTLRILTGGAA